MLGPSKPNSTTSAGEVSAIATAGKRAYSCAEYAFETLLRDSVVEVFNGTLGKIAGQALHDAIKRRAPPNGKDPLERPDFLHQMLIAHLGLVAHVLERKILRTLSNKTATAAPPSENTRVDFPSEVEKIRKQYLKRKKAGDQPQALE
jgi:hypothetical protein